MKVSDTFWHRFDIGLGFTYHLLPANLTFKEWLWSPEWGYEWPGKKMNGKTRSHIPQQMLGKKGMFALVGDDFYARYHWLHACLRVCGLDIGAEIFYKLKDKT